MIKKIITFFYQCMNQQNNRKAFTLAEILLAVAILVTLSAVSILTLNPTESFRESRDAKRFSDIGSLSALNAKFIYQDATAASSSIQQKTIYLSLPDSSETCDSWAIPHPSDWALHCVSSSTLRNMDGTGWLPINLQSAGLNDISALPVDPINTSSGCLYYAYIAGVPTGSFAAHLESSKYTEKYSSNTGFLSPGVFAIGTPPTGTQGLYYECIGDINSDPFLEGSSITVGGLTDTSTP